MTPLRMAGMVLACIVAGSSMSCGDNGLAGGDRPPASPVPIVPADHPDTIAYASMSAVLPASEVGALLANPDLAEDAKARIRDNTISFADYESAVLSAMQCMRDAGATFRADDPVLSARGVYTWHARIPGSPTDTSAVERSQRCVEDHINLIELYWKQTVQPSQRETMGAMKEMGDCMRSTGLAEFVPSTLDINDFIPIPQRLTPQARAGYVACARAVQDRWGLIGFISEAP